MYHTGRDRPSAGRPGDLAGDGGRYGYRRHQPREPLPKPCQRVGEGRQQAPDLAAPAARQDADQRGIGRDAVARTERGAIAAAGAAFQHRVADEAAPESGALEDRRLEGQQHHQVIERPGQPARTAGPPRPHRGRDVMHQRRALPPDARPDTR